jgi:hypothetical protein
MTIRIWLAASLIGLMTPAAALAAVQATFHVAPNGSDNNPGTETQPFATLEKARQTVRTANKNMTGDIVVVLRGGVYRIENPVAFDADDSGSGGHNVIYRAQTGETPVLSGGKPVTDWQANEKGRWKAPAPLDDFRQLYVGGKRAVRARGKMPAGLELTGNDGYKTTDVGMADWKNPDDVEFCYVISWTHTRCKVKSIKRDGDHAVITMLQPFFRLAKEKEGVNVGTTFNPAHDTMYVENALELLDEPGEWYLDRKAKTVYYLPRPGEDMTKVEVIAPAVEQLVVLRGTLDRPVENVQFQGLTFAHATWLLPSKMGLADTQSNFVTDWNREVAKRKQGSLEALFTVHNEYIKSPSNIICHAAKSIRFDRCTFTKLGSGGVDFECGAQNNAVVGCRFYDLAGTAVQIGDVLQNDHHPDDPRKIVKNNRVENCYIHDCCLDYMDGCAVFAGYTDGTVIAHNEITRLPSTAISVGWGWGEEDAGGGNPDYYEPYLYATPTPCKNNRIEANHIHHVLTTLDDGGSIYTLGNQPGTIIRGNYVHDNPYPARAREAGGRGIYCDEGSGFIEITGNLVLRSPHSGMFYNNKVQDRNKTCKEHDNYFDQEPPAAKPIAEKAGLESGYRDLLETPGDTRSTPPETMANEPLTRPAPRS